MAAITDTSHGLAYPVFQPDPVTLPPLAGLAAGWSAVRTCTRALEGMQKEAIVSESGGGTWRMVCDEGPYLHGTDLAPFPLAFFCTGMVTSFLQELRTLMASQGIAYSRLGLQQDNYYSMEGSAVAGTMTGSALPVELALVTDAQLSAEQSRQLLSDAVAAAPIGALLRQLLHNTFSITCQGQPLLPARVGATSTGVLPHQLPDFDALAPVTTPFLPDIISKLKSAQVQTGVAGGVGSSLTDSQKRVLHMRGNCALSTDGLMETTVELFSPIGSQFRFLADAGSAFNGQGRAPSGLAYLNAGLAFCYMTQIGRYAHIVRKPLDAYNLVQDMRCSAPGASGNTGKAAEMLPLETHVVIDCTHSSDFVRTLVDMSEQTCFLHAACRDQVKVKLRDQA